MIDFINQLKNFPACNSLLLKIALFIQYRCFSFSTVIPNDYRWHDESVLRTHPANPLQNHHIFAVPYFIKKFTETTSQKLHRASDRHALEVPSAAFSPDAHHLFSLQCQHLGLTFLWATCSESRGSGVGWTVLYCQQSKQLSWAQQLYTGSLGNPFFHGMVFWGPAVSLQVAETFWSPLQEGLP